MRRRYQSVKNILRVEGCIKLLALLVVSLSAAPAAAAPFVYVANFYSGDVSVIDTATNTVVATVPVGVQAAGVAITPHGAFAYVTHGGPLDAGVSVLATATNTVVATVPVGIGPTAVAITPGRVPLAAFHGDGGDQIRRAQR